MACHAPLCLLVCSQSLPCSKGKAAEELRGAPYLLPLEEVARRTAEAWERGATEVCMQVGRALLMGCQARNLTACCCPGLCLGRRQASNNFEAGTEGPNLCLGMPAVPAGLCRGASIPISPATATCACWKPLRPRRQASTCTLSGELLGQWQGQGHVVAAADAAGPHCWSGCAAAVQTSCGVLCALPCSPLEVQQGAATLGWPLHKYLTALRDAGGASSARAD